MVTNPKEIAYFDDVYKWVDYLDYPNNWGSPGPFESRWGENPHIVYKRLFGEPFYYILNEKELKTLRTTIQYKAVYLDDSYNKQIKFFEKLGFKVYRKEKSTHNDGRSDWLSCYMKRENISLYVSNLETPQDYRPNTIVLMPGIYVTNKKTGKVRRKSIDRIFVQLLDELDKKTKEAVEKVLLKLIEKYADNN